MYSKPNRTVFFQWISDADYKQTWDYQEALLQSIVNLKIYNRDHQACVPTPNYLIFCEHPAVYTLGKSGDARHLLLSEAECQALGVQYFPINRGGDITYHGKGQLVAYPILDLENFKTDLNVYLRNLEEVVIQTIAYYGIKGHRIKGLTGVWVDIERNPRKIAAMGIRCSRWVSMHGLALNVNTDLAYFQYIIPCGIADKGVTSIQKETGQEIPMEEVIRLMRSKFEEVLDCQVVEEPFPIPFGS